MVYKNMSQKKKPLTPHPRFLVGDYYVNNDNQHQKNERVHNQGSYSIVELVVNGRKVEKKRKNPISGNFQFVEARQTHV
jgi:hypothetical protein